MREVSTSLFLSVYLFFLIPEPLDRDRNTMHVLPSVTQLVHAFLWLETYSRSKAHNVAHKITPAWHTIIFLLL